MRPSDSVSESSPGSSATQSGVPTQVVQQVQATQQVGGQAGDLPGGSWVLLDLLQGK